jgi:hypothetical protein
MAEKADDVHTGFGEPYPLQRNRELENCRPIQESYGIRSRRANQFVIACAADFVEERNGPDSARELREHDEVRPEVRVDGRSERVQNAVQIDAAVLIPDVKVAQEQ